MHVLAHQHMLTAANTAPVKLQRLLRAHAWQSVHVYQAAPAERHHASPPESFRALSYAGESCLLCIGLP